MVSVVVLLIVKFSWIGACFVQFLDMWFVLVVTLLVVVTLVSALTGLLVLNWGVEVVLAFDACFVNVGDAGVSKVTLLLFIDEIFVSPIASIVVVGVTLAASRCIPGSVFLLFFG
jgi:hypothetical protein